MIDAMRQRARMDREFAPAADMLDALRAVWAATLGIPLTRIDAAADFFALGGDSLLSVEALHQIELRLGVALPDDALIEAPTPGELTGLIAERSQTRRRLRPLRGPLVCVQPRGTGRPIYVITGGSGLRFNNVARIARVVDFDRPFYVFSGHVDDVDAPPERWVAATTSEHLAAVRAVQADGVYFIVGTCAGGIMAWEAARQLAHDGERVAVMLVDTPLGTTIWGADDARRESPRAKGVAAYRAAPFSGDVTLLISPNWSARANVEAWASFAAGSRTTIMLPPAAPNVHALQRGQQRIIAAHLRDWIARIEGPGAA